ncbi:MAG TPA: hypothetical protein DEP84_07350, partial [Chloroflexi bacterium]|nr:hypothetical protein [Chloroflexota bacterium]
RLLAEGSPADLLLQHLQAGEPTDDATLRKNLPFPSESAEAALAQLLEEGRARRLADGSLLSATGWTRLTTEMATALADYHREFPLRLGMPREELASRLNLKPKPFAALLAAAEAEGLVVESGGVVRLPEYEVHLSRDQEDQVRALLAQFEAAPYTPPNAGDAARTVGDELLSLLIARGDLIRVSPEVLLTPAVYDEMSTFVVEHITAHGGIVAGELRDRFDTSRKYAIALLEHLDNKRVTRRIGDKRILR